MKLPISRARHDNLMAAKSSEITGLGLSLAAEKGRAERIAGRLLDAIAERTAQRERDEYRERLLRFTAPRERGPGGRFMKVDGQPAHH